MTCYGDAPSSACVWGQKPRLLWPDSWITAGVAPPRNSSCDWRLVLTHLLAIDQGTTSTRAFLFDASLQPKGFAQLEFPQIFPAPGWVEHDPQGIWTTSVATARAAMASADVTADDVAAIGITNQRETTIVWDRRTGKPVHNAIVWQDRRTSAYCDELKDAGYSKMIQEKTGLIIDAYFSATKIKWLLDNVAGARQRAEEGTLAFGTVDSWLVWNLTGGAVHVTDVTNASRTMLLTFIPLHGIEASLNFLIFPKSCFHRFVRLAKYWVKLQ